MNVIEVKELVKTYEPSRFSRRGRVEAVKGVSFTVEEGEIFGVLGPNGAGKTTTLEIIEGINNLSSGEVLVFDKEITRHAQEVKRLIGVQLQSSEYLPLLTLREQLEMFRSLFGSHENPVTVLKFVGLEEKADAYVKELSGGQKQRFTIAAALVHKPKILFLDEPTTGLDPAARRKVWRLIRDIRDNGVTIVLTTHFMEEAEYLCDRVAIMDKGLILTIDNPRNLIDQLSHTTQVSFFTDQKFEEEFWKSLTGVGRMYSVYPKVILELKSLDGVTEIMEYLKQTGVSFTGFTVKTATLEDVYLDLTGRELGVEHV